MSLRFINHASIEVNYGAGTLLTDPWFFGQVFNDSWALIADGVRYDVEKLRYIWISHEHPDHLHFPTLREIRAQATQAITVLFRQQADKSVVKSIAALGYEVIELEPRLRLEVTEGLAITCFPTRADSALLIEAGGLRIFNQNDCRLNQRQLRPLGCVDVWLFQFSIAGHSGNVGDDFALAASGASHLRMIERYAGWIKPRLYVPFASFIRFCHPLNDFMNAWRVTPAAVASLSLECPIRFLRPGEDLDSPDGLAWWTEAFSRSEAPRPLVPLGKAELMKLGQRFVKLISRDWPDASVPPRTSVRLEPDGDFALIDLRKGEFAIETEPTGRLVAVMDSQSLGFLMRFPWGADTVHISGVAAVLDDYIWRWLLFVRHAEYKLAKMGWMRKLVPRPMAWLRSGAWRRVKP